MSDCTIQANQMCAGLYAAGDPSVKEWHRGKILNRINEKIVRVSFVDYGTQTQVEKKDLRFLHRDFALLPAQAFLGHLSRVVPPNGNKFWDSKANRRFLALGCVSELRAEVLDVNYEVIEYALYVWIQNDW